MNIATDWQIDINTPGAIVQGLQDIDQCIGIILTTVPGTDPLRPLFGCGLHNYIDQPALQAGAQMAREIATALRLWEPRITVPKITYSVMAEHIHFSIPWKMKVGYSSGDASLLVGLYEQLVMSPIFSDISPYISAVLATESLFPISTETGIGLEIQNL